MIHDNRRKPNTKSLPIRAIPSNESVTSHGNVFQSGLNPAVILPSEMTSMDVHLLLTLMFRAESLEFDFTVKLSTTLFFEQSFQRPRGRGSPL